MRSSCTPVKSGPCSPQWEKAYMQQWRSSTAKKKKKKKDCDGQRTLWEQWLSDVNYKQFMDVILVGSTRGHYNGRWNGTTGLGTSKTMLIRMLRLGNQGWNPGEGGHLIYLHRTSLRTAFQPWFQDLEAMNNKTSVKKIRKLILRIWLKEARS